MVLRETLLPLPNESGFADAKDFCRACDACSTVYVCVVLPSLLPMNCETPPTCCLDLVHIRFEYDTTLYYL